MSNRNRCRSLDGTPVPGTRYRKVWKYDSTPWRRRVRDLFKFKTQRLHQRNDGGIQ